MKKMYLNKYKHSQYCFRNWLKYALIGVLTCKSLSTCRHVELCPSKLSRPKFHTCFKGCTIRNQGGGHGSLGQAPIFLFFKTCMHFFNIELGGSSLVFKFGNFNLSATHVQQGKCYGTIPRALFSSRSDFTSLNANLYLIWDNL